MVEITLDGLILASGILRFYRPKTKAWGKHELTEDTLEALRGYLKSTGIKDGILLRGTTRHGTVTDKPMTTRGTNKRVSFLGKHAGLFVETKGKKKTIRKGILSPHDCRHYWATQAVKQGTTLEDLKRAGGWNSLAMPERYINEGKVDNEGVKL